MKRILMVAGALLVGGAASAAINPSSPGLPGETALTTWTMTAAQGYGAVNIASGLTTADSKGSAMCVECHSVNPSGHITQPSQGAACGITNTAANRGTHFVMNILGTPSSQTSPWGSTHSGGGFVGGYSNTFRGSGLYMMRTAWPAAGGAAAPAPESKYNVLATGLQSNRAGNVATWGAQDMICESCHNILVNQGAGLALGLYNAQNNDDICVTCHSGNGTTGATGYAAFHGNGMLAAFAGTGTRKRHHVLTGNTFGFYGTNGYDSIMWAPTFSDKQGTGTYAGFSLSQTLTAASTVAFRTLNNVTGAGTRASASGDMTQTGSTIQCVGCHRPHNAKSTAGAFILRSGWNGACADFPTGNQGTSRAASGTDGYGIRRQFDVGDWTASKIYREYTSLCNSCHTGYGSGN